MFNIEEHPEHDKTNVVLTLDGNFKDDLYEHLKQTDGGCHVYDAKQGEIHLSVNRNSDGQRNLYEELKGIKNGESHPNLSDVKYFSVLVENLQRMGDGVEHRVRVS